MQEDSVFDEEENDDVDLQRTFKSETMSIFFREVAFLAILTFCAFVSVFNSEVKTKEGPPSAPFFLYTEDVDDFYLGEFSPLMEQIRSGRLTFLMLYAPWDADSQDARQEFQSAAEFYYDKVYFASVNCWEPGSECRSAFKDVSFFPQFVAYMGIQKNVVYHGPHDANHMIRFLHSLLHPFKRINTIADLWKMRFLHDAVLVGFFEFMDMRVSRIYTLFYETSLRMAGRDHLRKTGFAVYTNSRMNHYLDVHETPSLVLFLWDRHIVYTGEWTVQSVIKWLVSESEKGLSQMSSNTLLPHVKDGAVLAMFTPQHPLAVYNPYYQMLKRIAMKFHTCDNNSTEAFEAGFSPNLVYFEEFYSNYEGEIIKEELVMREHCSLTRKSQQYSCIATIPNSRLDNISFFETRRSCPNVKLKYAERLLSRRKYYKRMYSNDFGEAEMLRSLANEERCELLARTPFPIVLKRSKHDLIVNSCQTNKTISFLVLDSDKFSHLAEGLGLSPREKKDHTAVALFNSELILQIKASEVSEDGIIKLLNKFLEGELSRRFLRSSHDLPNAHHTYRPLPDKSSQVVSVEDLSVQNFLPAILNQTESVLVLYHTKYCSFCVGVSHAFLSVAHLLTDIPNLKFFRVDGEINDLPWQYSVHSYPSILIFPARRKSESRIFPHNMAVNVYSLSRFILGNIDMKERIPVMLALCGMWGDAPDLSEEGHECVRNVRISSLKAISDTLKKYRWVLKRLKHNPESSPLHQAHLATLKRFLELLQHLKAAHLRLGQVKSIKDTLKVFFF